MANQKVKKAHKFLHVLIRLVVITFLAFEALYFFEKSSTTTKKLALNYSEKGNIDYRVCLKENEFYEDQCLSKDMKYVASLIDKIYVTMDYSFITDQFINSTYTYSIIGKVIISDSNDDNDIIYSKNYNLINSQIEYSKENKIYSINKIIDIDYFKYNDLASKFKATYGLTSNARLEILLKVNNNGSSVEYNELRFNKDTALILSIPLSQNSININLKYENINNNSNIYYYSNREIINYYYLILTILFAVIALIIMISLILYISKNINQKSAYEKALRKILREYDRVIVESARTIGDFTDDNVIFVKKFTELLDVRDNLKLPIIFNEIEKGRKSLFYIEDDKTLYLYVLKNKMARGKDA